jgi:hypothetical protein
MTTPDFLFFARTSLSSRTKDLDCHLGELSRLADGDGRRRPQCSVQRAARALASCKLSHVARARACAQTISFSHSVLPPYPPLSLSVSPSLPLSSPPSLRPSPSPPPPPTSPLSSFSLLSLLSLSLLSLSLSLPISLSLPLSPLFPCAPPAIKGD